MGHIIRRASGVVAITGVIAAGVGLLISGMTPADAAIIYTTLGQPGDTYFSFQGYTPFDTNTTTNSIGSPFTPGGTYALSDIKLALGYRYGTNGATIALTSDLGGVPGPPIESWTYNNLTPDSSGGSVVTVNDHASAVLGPAQYWVTVSPPPYAGTDNGEIWYIGDPSTLGTVAFYNGSAWSADSGNLPGFRVDGDPVVPEPSTLALMSSAMPGALGVAWLRRRKRK